MRVEDRNEEQAGEGREETRNLKGRGPTEMREMQW
jgi:hypothetical protein